MNRFARLATALCIVTTVGMQIPTRNGTALAADCYGTGCGGNSHNGGKVFGTNLNWEEVGSTVLLAFVGDRLIKTFRDHGSTGVRTSYGSENGDRKNNTPEAREGAGSLASENSLLDVTSPGVRGLLAKCPELEKTLQNDGPYTLFLPSDETLSKVRLDPAKLENLLKRHIVIGRYSYDDLTLLSEGATLQTLAETKLAVTHADGNVQIGGITVPSVAQVGNNGFQFVIEGILP